MSTFNQVLLVGHLGQYPEVMNPETHFVKLSVATSKKYNDAKGETKVDTQWHKVYLNGRCGKYAAAYLKTGDKVLIRGELRINQWLDKVGNKHSQTVINGYEIVSVSSKSTTEPSETSSPDEEDFSARDEISSYPEEYQDDDSIPDF